MDSFARCRAGQYCGFTVNCRFVVERGSKFPRYNQRPLPTVQAKDSRWEGYTDLTEEQTKRLGDQVHGVRLTEAELPTSPGRHAEPMVTITAFGIFQLMSTMHPCSSLVSGTTSIIRMRVEDEGRQTGRATRTRKPKEGCSRTER